MNLQEHLEKLVVFEAICRLKGFSAAAIELGRSQPAVSRSIKELEDVVGVKLLKRWNKGIELSEVGQKLLATSQSILRTTRDFEIQYAENQRAHEIISIGTKEPIAIYIWAEFVAWCKHTPGQQEIFAHLKHVDLKIEKSNRKLTQSFNNRDLDMLIIPPDNSISPSSIAVKILDTVWNTYVASDHSDPFETTPLIIYEQTLVSETAHLKDVLDLKNYPAAVLKVNSLGAALALCNRGLGATILPTWMTEGALRRGELRIFDKKDEYQGPLPKSSRILAAYFKERTNKSATVSLIVRSLQLFLQKRRSTK